ncbi:hypothetical protein [Stappia indica]|uniref:Uncharacterized protein n=1 Tax=Stappia indica TaxID=538381 RepID=A0A857C509_9HYPH|nr:hypothetical protein [Stappia indica]QGZ33935.1 hypothetical protein GH266_05065 [Stappia indica]
MALTAFARFDPAEQARRLRLHLSLCPEGQRLTLDMSKAYCQGLIDVLERDQRAVDLGKAAGAALQEAEAMRRAALAMMPLRKAQERQAKNAHVFWMIYGMFVVGPAQSLFALVCGWLS